MKTKTLATLLLIGFSLLVLVSLVLANWDGNTCEAGQNCLISVYPVNVSNIAQHYANINCTIFVYDDLGNLDANQNMTERVTGFYEYNVTSLASDEYNYKVACDSYWVDTGYFRVNSTNRELSSTATINYDNIWPGVWNYTGVWGRYIWGIGG